MKKLLATSVLAAALVSAVTARVRQPQVIAWLWPKLEAELRAFDAHKETDLFPGLKSKDMRALCAQLDEAELERALNTAFSRIWGKLAPHPKGMPRAKKVRKAKKAKKAGKKAAKALKEAAIAAPMAAATDIGSEFGQLSSFVRANVIGGIGAWPNLRDGMFATFGAAGKPSAAIPRINVYYARLVEANFPPVVSSWRSFQRHHLILRCERSAPRRMARGRCSCPPFETLATLAPQRL